MATTRHVAKTGNNSNSGLSLGAAYLTIAKGLSVMSAGDTLYIHTGTYTEQISTSSQTVPTGTSWSNAVTIAAYAGETVTLKPASGYAILAIIGNSWKYLIFDGLHFDATHIDRHSVNLDGVHQAGAGHIRFRNCEMAFGPRSGVMIGRGSDFNEFLNCNVHHNISPTVDAPRAYAFYMQTSNNLIDGGEVHHNSGYGIHIYNGYDTEYANNNTIRGVRAYTNSTVTAGQAGILLSSGTNNRAINCICYDNPVGIRISQVKTSNCKVYNCTVTDNAQFGIDVGISSSGAILKNNIVYANPTNIRNSGTGTVQANNPTSNPLFVNPGTRDYHLQSGSAAIDAGVTLSEVPTDFDLKIRPFGPSYDIGAYEYGSTVVVTPPPVLTPTAPSGLSVTVLSSSSLRPNWTDNSSNESGFEVYRSLTGSGAWVKVTTTAANATSFTDTGLSAATTYFYQVRAINAAGSSTYTSIVSAITAAAPVAAPAAPSSLNATATSPTVIALTWTRNATTETSVKIERALSPGTIFVQIATVGATITAYTDSGRTPSTQYFYRVRNSNIAGDSAYSNTDNDTTPAAPPTTPDAPSALVVTVISYRQIDVSWTDNSDDEDGFAIERSEDAIAWEEIARVGENVTFYSDLGSDQSTLPIDHSITISWEDAAADEDGFKIERAFYGGSFTQIATVSANVLTYTDTGLAPSTEYTYRVRSTNAAGDSTYSNTASHTTAADPPGSNPPTGILAGHTYFYRVRAFNEAGYSAYAVVTNATTPPTDAVDTNFFDINQLRSLLLLSPLPNSITGTEEYWRHLLGLYRGPFAATLRVLVGPLNIAMQFITLADLYLDYGTFYYANYYHDNTTLYVPRLVGHGTITEELPDLFNTVMGRRNASIRFSTIETGNLESPTLAYHAITEDLYSQHALVRIYNLKADVESPVIMALNAPITSYDIASGQLKIEDDADAIFDTLIPKVRLREIYPNVDLSTGRGQDPPVIIPFGVMRKVPLYLVQTTEADYSNQEFRYGAVRKPLTGTLTFATVYRDGQVIDEDEYFIVENPDGYYNVAFLVDQRDTGGRPLPILVDLVSSEFGHSPALAIDFLLSDSTYGLGQEVNPASITQAALDYLGVSERIGGGLWQQQTAKSILPLLLLHGAYITRNDGHQWLLTVDTIDKHAQPTDDLLQFGLGDTAAWQNITSIQPNHRKVNERLKLLTVKGVWDPDFTGSGSWLVTSDRSRTVAGTVKVIENPFISDPGTVDRECDYLFTRYAAQDRSLSVQTTTEAYILELGYLIKVNISNYSLSEQLFEVRSKTFVGEESTAFGFGLYGWDPNAFIFTPGHPIILPRALVLSDFRRTPPDAPTGFEILGYTVGMGIEGPVESLVTFTANAPSDNVSHLVFVSFRAGSGIIRSMIQVPCDPGQVGVLGSLDVTPGLFYDYECYALQIDNDADRQESTRAQILNQLAIGDVTPPNPPTGLIATAGVGRTISLDWADNTEDDFKTYVVYRSLDAAFTSAYAIGATGNEVGEVRASRMVDQHEIVYETFYYYRVKAKDLSGNLSGWSNTSVAYVHRLTAQDPGDGIIHTPHRQPFNALVSSVSVSAHTSFQYDTGLSTDDYAYTAGCLGIQATDEWASNSPVDGTRLFEFIGSGPVPGGFDRNYHVGLWNGVNATWNTTVRAFGW